MSRKEWTVRLTLDEAGDVTDASAVLEANGVEVARATGRARRNPADRPVARVGDELAASRALYALADRLMDVTAEDIDLAEGHG
jgi:hypothetical protein